MDIAVSPEVNRHPFDSAVCVRTSENTKRDVRTVACATEVLTDWPHAKRGPVYQTTMGILQAALAGRVTADEAREAFETFAEHAGVLVDC